MWHWLRRCSVMARYCSSQRWWLTAQANIRCGSTYLTTALSTNPIWRSFLVGLQIGYLSRKWAKCASTGPTTFTTISRARPNRQFGGLRGLRRSFGHSGATGRVISRAQVFTRISIKDTRMVSATSRLASTLNRCSIERQIPLLMSKIVLAWPIEMLATIAGAGRGISTRLSTLVGHWCQTHTQTLPAP